LPKVWVLRGLKKGILTSGFPAKEPAPDEIPERSQPPMPTPETDWSAGERECPTSAIQSKDEKIRLGQCIYCRRCSSAGFSFEGGPDGRSRALQGSISELGPEKVRKLPIFRKSLHIMMIDIGSCNACNLEVLNLSNPYYDLTRLGIFFTNSPKHADALVVVGALNRAMVDVLKRTYDSIPEPKLVISVGACAISGGIFRSADGFASDVQDVIPVDVTVPGCPPSPIQVLEGLLLATGKLEKREVMR
jgi:Ni,Fe-hydrogenase III small subunit